MKGRSKKATGGVNQAAEDLAKSNMEYTKDSNVNREAVERSVRKSGGKIKGEAHKGHAGRKPRKSGGRAGSESNPFTSAQHGTPPKGHKVEKETMGKGV